MEVSLIVKDAIFRGIKNIEYRCRLNLFFFLNDNQLFSYMSMDSEKGEIVEFEGLKLFVTEHFGRILKEKDEFEINGEIKSNYPFLYEGFKQGCSLFVKKIYVGNEPMAFVELLIELPFLTDDVKSQIDLLINELSFTLPKVYLNVLKDVSRKFACLNMLNLIKAIRPRTFYHSFRVADLSVTLAKSLGLCDSKIRDIYYASLIHDIGEIWIPNDILDKKNKLTEEELELVKSHTTNLRQIFLHNPFMEDIVNIAIYHHEREDGKGYYGIKGDSISIESKVLSICEFIDGLHTDRPDRPGLSVEQIVHFLKELKDKAFDSKLVDMAIPMVKRLYDREIDFKGVMSGKPVILLFYKNKDLNLIKGVVEYSAGNNLGVSLSTPEGRKLEFKDRVRVQVPAISKIIDIVAEVLSSTDDIVNLLILDEKDVEDRPLEVYWELDMLVVPLKLSQGTSLKSVNKIIRMRTNVFGTKSLLAKSKDATFSIGDTVLIKIKPKNETISIPAVVSDIVDDGGIYTIRFEFFGLNESEDAKVHRAIYSRQIELGSS